MKIVVDSQNNATLIGRVYPEFRDRLFAKPTSDLALQWTEEWANRGQPTLLVLDTQSVEPNAESETERQSLRILDRSSGRYDVVAISPALVARLFERPDVHQALDPEGAIDAIVGQWFDPYGALEKLAQGRTLDEMLDRLDEEQWQSLRADPAFLRIKRTADSLSALQTTSL